MHIHEVVFEVVNRQEIFVNEDGHGGSGQCRIDHPPEPWETGFKDTVIAYPGQVTRVRVTVQHARASSSGTATSSSTRTTR